jgi:hypothetical protein
MKSEENGQAGRFDEISLHSSSGETDHIETRSGIICETLFGLDSKMGGRGALRAGIIMHRERI